MRSYSITANTNQLSGIVAKLLLKPNDSFNGTGLVVTWTDRYIPGSNWHRIEQAGWTSVSTPPGKGIFGRWVGSDWRKGGLFVDIGGGAPNLKRTIRLDLENENDPASVILFEMFVYEGDQIKAADKKQPAPTTTTTTNKDIMIANLRAAKAEAERRAAEAERDLANVKLKAMQDQQSQHIVQGHA